jgi:hypothetical protein
MKQIRHFKPNASIEHIEATLMWINNKTVEWLDSMDLQDKNANITLAPDYLAKWQERRKVACPWSVVLSRYSGFCHHENWTP